MSTLRAFIGSHAGWRTDDRPLSTLSCRSQPDSQDGAGPSSEALADVTNTPTASGDLTDQIAGLKLNDMTADADSSTTDAVQSNDDGSVDADSTSSVPVSASELSSKIGEISEAITAVRSLMFEFEEQRHLGSSKDAEKVIMRIDEALEAISAAVQQLEKTVEQHLKDAPQGPSSHADSDSDSDDDNDDDFGFNLGKLSSVQDEWTQIVKDWTAIQQDVDRLKKELEEDMQIAQFESLTSQAQELIESLEKAISIGQAFVSELKSKPDGSFEDAEDGDLGGERRLESLHVVRKAFQTKRDYYTPACESLFTVFDRTLRNRQTSHGGVLRRLTDLKLRWRQLRESSKKMERDFKKVEAKLLGVAVEPAIRPSVGSEAPQTFPSTSSQETRQQPLLPPRPSAQPNLSPPRPMKSTRRLSSMGSSTRTLASIRSQAQYEPMPSPAKAGPTSTRPVSVLGISSTNRTAAGQRSPTKASASPSRPPTSFRQSQILSTPTRKSMPAPPGSVPSYRHRAGSEPPADMPTASSSRPRDPIGASNAVHPLDSDDLIESIDSRPSSALSQHQPMSYRPRSSMGVLATPDSKAARRQSRIPMLAFAPSDDQSPRPGSALSQASSTFATPSRSSRYSGASRLAMQTPEPMIAARTQRLNMFVKPSSAGAVPSTSSGTPSRRTAASKPPLTRMNPRTSAASVLGRTTPLSASALARVPNATNSMSSPASAAGPYASSTAASSVANYRAAKARSSLGVGAHHKGAASVSGGREGAISPFSESGRSTYSMSGFSRRESGAASVIGNGPFTPYRANPNDALEVEIAKVTNARGVYLTREDPPLPRGVKMETGPGKDVRCRYRFGSSPTVMTCKLLELHKPGRGSATGGDDGRQRKVMVKVAGQGFLDLNLWLARTFVVPSEEEEDLKSMGDRTMDSHITARATGDQEDIDF